MNVEVLVGLGSNLDGPARQLEIAFELLESISPESEMLGRSSLYRSAPFGGIEQPDFVNAAAAMTTSLRRTRVSGRAAGHRAVPGQGAGGCPLGSAGARPGPARLRRRDDQREAVSRCRIRALRREILYCCRCARSPRISTFPDWGVCVTSRSMSKSRA